MKRWCTPQKGWSGSQVVKETYTVNSEIIAMFLLLRKLGQGNNCNNLNSIFLNVAEIKIAL